MYLWCFSIQYNCHWSEGSYNIKYIKAIAQIFQGENDWIDIRIISYSSGKYLNNYSKIQIPAQLHMCILYLLPTMFYLARIVESWLLFDCCHLLTNVTTKTRLNSDNLPTSISYVFELYSNIVKIIADGFISKLMQFLMCWCYYPGAEKL